jgi:hypothetical protein
MIDQINQIATKYMYTCTVSQTIEVIVNSLIPVSKDQNTLNFRNKMSNNMNMIIENIWSLAVTLPSYR